MGSVLGGRLELSIRTALIGLGDALMIALFVGLGELRHGGNVGAGLETFLQFGVGWALAAIVAGAYAADAIETRRRAGIRAVVAWIIGALVAQVLRMAFTSGTVAPVFVVVSIVVGGSFVGVWRVMVASFAK